LGVLYFCFYHNINPICPLFDNKHINVAISYSLQLDAHFSPFHLMEFASINYESLSV